ncbi:putative beta-1,3-galactosyltransferase [Helicobacter cinaedi CCUG 18818 = ATCC BAA-847]|uniref:Beta-1,3-galactosyltransferase n=1 Tax=Helicobacter cinaedi CCUG 18818 = ATCC BAA-847 TaxID=537971 RepID=A0AAI8MMC1_9HELI|nr:glycosyltransferase family 2 protein [Helicobacter cinaedi]BAM31567.1 putative beta-1,3-galactosyltransferase [Helicobacter cinaedi CCUG 18818 = ATCC BAA-847]
MIQNCKCAISIIIPTYNVESYIARCLDSCINQTLHNIEILVIDDCGSDDSIAIAQRYADKDSRIRIIHNEKNLGTFGSRIEGIKAAGGRYIAFLDADDYLKLETCEKMLQLFTDSTLANTHTLIDLKTVESTPDIIHFKSHYTVNKQTKPLAKLTHYTRYMLPTRFSKAPLHNEQIAYNFFLNSKQFPKFTIWDKCYKTALVKQTLPLIESFIPLKLTMAEDMLKFFVISAFAKSYVSVDSRLYMYCLNDGSITQNPQAKQKKINDMSYIIQALHSLSKKLKSHNALMPTIAQVMSKNLAALIILESRLSGMHGGGDIVESQHNSTSHSAATRQSLQDSLHSTQMTEILAPLMPLVESGLIPAPKMSKYMRYIRSQYLLSCILSLQYWNRCLTYIRIFAYTLSLGKIKL